LRRTFWGGRTAFTAVSNATAKQKFTGWERDKRRTGSDSSPAIGSSLKPGFFAISYRLKAADAKAIVAALKQDMTGYLRDIEEEQPILKELGEELAQLLRVAPPDAKG
jgi:hypothetical protein